MGIKVSFLQQWIFSQSLKFPFSVLPSVDMIPEEIRFSIPPPIQFYPVLKRDRHQTLWRTRWNEISRHDENLLRTLSFYVCFNYPSQCPH